MNVYNLLEQAARRFPEHGAVYVGSDLRLTYAELRNRTLRLAAALQQRYGEGARVAIASENCAEFVELMFGTWAAGQVIVPLNYKLHPKEMVQIIEDAAVSAVFVSSALAEGLRDALPASGTWSGDTRVIGETDYEALFGVNALAVPVTSPDALAWLFYTSGTTGRSKGAMLSHRNLLAMTVAHLADVENFDESASQIHAAPMSHGSGLYIPAYISRGARQVIPASSGFEPEEFLDLCDTHPGCGAFLAPTMVQRLRLAAEAAHHRPKNLRTVIYGGGPMYVEELKKSLRVFGQVFVQIYGQGESPMTITSLRRADHALTDDAVLGSVGCARMGVQVAVVDEQGGTLPDGEVGEIICRGDVVMSGYWNNPGATADALRDGWLYTGDIGSLDARGYLTLRDRSKDVVISGGSNIYPREVEEALLTLPAVAEACVVGQADDEWGEVVVAFVVLAPNANASTQEIDAHCLSRIARFKRPKRYVFVDELPKNSYGKVLKRELRQRLVSSTGGGGAG
jgi:acyl-CoA synthetase (AMP-forming)/AMP-acid ligase II